MKFKKYNIMTTLYCNFHKKDIKHDISCQVCWAAKIHDPTAVTQKECVILNQKILEEKSS